MRKRRALIFSDEVIIAYLFNHFFSSRGYEAFTFPEPDLCPIYRSTEDACTLGHPCADVIISAVSFPRMNALDLLREQSRRGCRLPNPNKALISGRDDAVDSSKISAQGGAVFHIPIDFSLLSSWVDECEKRVDPSEPLSERRREERKPCDHKVACRLDKDSEPLAGTAVNVSSSGLCLRITAPLFVGQLIRIKTDEPDVWRIARVVWVNKNGDGTCLAGLFCD